MKRAAIASAFVVALAFAINPQAHCEDEPAGKKYITISPEAPTAEKPAGKEDKELAADLALLQGSWELIHGQDGKAAPSTRSVKTIEGNNETLRRYNLQTGQLRVEHTSEFKLTKSGSVRVFTFFEPGETAKNGLSYVYSVDKENFYDVPGLLQWLRIQELPNSTRHLALATSAKEMSTTKPRAKAKEKLRSNRSKSRDAILNPKFALLGYCMFRRNLRLK